MVNFREIAAGQALPEREFTATNIMLRSGTPIVSIMMKHIQQKLKSIPK